ncbi:RlmE family RNA methyltransferase [Thiohalorhabdus denitrificans]|uniref:Ribosomal RNA large subunit methyltransferase E n=1 Tax=Thiohalorhabdus denitrificans TaxID=381306 RepID=A0A1G5GZJ7_9GAMM|nr:RlmE family RNA methyltransferase [Thiohalorhabdus denitrificans]SCY56540.1 23S rRNA (uridine2552-2'-O)-methyltransferase [Thiohalorhabdus denitrificans]
MGKGNRWQRRQAADPYVAEARRAGYRSRAAFKLIQLDDRDRFLGPGAVVVDLGAAPGGWTQVAVERVGASGRVVGIDLLPMDPVSGSTLLEADFAADEGLEALRREIDGGEVDAVLSDMAPELSGIKVADQARAMELCELALELAREVLRPGGTLVMKAFQGEGFEELLRALRAEFRSVAARKPDASRGESSEQYLVARGFLGN